MITEKYSDSYMDCTRFHKAGRYGDRPAPSLRLRRRDRQGCDDLDRPPPLSHTYTYNIYIYILGLFPTSLPPSSLPHPHTRSSWRLHDGSSSKDGLYHTS
ncbi:hypothetical protein HanRHA438_Chr12g0541811 [Helianthus annuus]|nr:hypothetical protein HanRHA438_Chr12g0541811 [Helianthus annuus]